MAKSKRKQKLKVYRTPVGFHDAYVAAPSQKAALEAWGVETNLFAAGAAEEVTEPELMKVPLEHPGEVVKVLRGTRAEQLAALDKFEGPRPSSRESRLAQAEVVARKPRKRTLKPSRAALEKAKEQLEALDKRQSEQLAKIDREMEALERRRSELQSRHERERDKAVEKVESEREKYEDALARSG